MVRGDEVRVKSALAVPPNEVLQLGEIRQRKTHGIGGHCDLILGDEFAEIRLHGRKVERKGVRKETGGGELRLLLVAADRLSKAGWSWGCVSAIDSNGRTVWIVDAHRDNGKRFVVRADEKLTAFVELEIGDSCWRGDLPDWTCSASRRTPTLLTCKKRSPGPFESASRSGNSCTLFESHDEQLNTITGSCERPPKNPYDGTESNFVAILQLSVRNKNVIDLCPVC